MKILLIRLSSLGDIILTQPISAKLKEYYPDSEIHFLVKPAYAGLLKAFGSIDKIIPYQKTLAFYFSLLKEDYDLVIDLQAKFSSWWLRRFIKTRSRAVYKKKHIARWLYVKTHKGKGIESTLKLYYSVFPKLGLPVGQNAANLRKPHLKPLDTGIEKILFSNLRECKMKIIALFPGAAHQTKMYPPSSWMEVIGKSDADWYYLLLGSAQESFIASVIKNQYPLKCENLCGKYSPEQLISVIDGCDLVLSNDSGPMHIAAALSKPQIAIFGATHPKLGFSPLNDNAVVLSADLDCQPCSLHGSERCPQKHFACMRDISADHILMKMREIL